jgi:hypothetical protein
MVDRGEERRWNAAEGGGGGWSEMAGRGGGGYIAAVVVVEVEVGGGCNHRELPLMCAVQWREEVEGAGKTRRRARAYVARVLGLVRSG